MTVVFVHFQPQEMNTNINTAQRNVKLCITSFTFSKSYFNSCFDLFCVTNDATFAFFPVNALDPDSEEFDDEVRKLFCVFSNILGFFFCFLDQTVLGTPRTGNLQGFTPSYLLIIK